MNVVFLIDPIETLNVKKDTTLALISAAQALHWQCFICEQGDVTWVEGITRVNATAIQLASNWSDPERSTSETWYVKGETSQLGADDIDIMMMRKDPPFDMNYINTTYQLEQLENVGVLVCNKPQSLRDCNEKFFTSVFPELIPPQIISSDQTALTTFHQMHGDVVYKPLDGMGGRGIFRIRPQDPNLQVVLETLTDNFQIQIVGQKFLAEIEQGDKRILLIDGKPVPFALARIPRAGENRGNLAAGGTGVGQSLTPRDEEICATVGPELSARGLYFAGIDVIGDCLTEVNVTCPTCVRELDQQFDLNIGRQLMENLGGKLA